MSQCEINDVIRRADRALCSVCGCGEMLSRCLECSAVKINGEYRITCEGNVCNRMLSALAGGETVTCKFTGRNCCGTYCVTASGEPDNVTLCGCNGVKFTLCDFDTDGVLRF